MADSALLPFLRQLTILTKDAQAVALEPNFTQKKILSEVERCNQEGRPVRLIISKARRLGVSTISEAILFLNTLSPNTNSTVVAQDAEASEYLFSMTKTMYDTSPYKDLFKTRFSTRWQIEFKETRSRFWTMTATSVKKSRSKRINHLHGSEVAFWARPEEQMLALRQTVPDLPGTTIILESTSNGIGNWWEDTWIEATMGRNEYTPLFFPWFEDPSSVPCFGVSCTDGSCEKCQTQAKALGKLDSEERDLKRRGVSEAALAWRRWAIPNKTFGNLDLFHQEFPASAEESFLATGVTAFPEEHLKACFEPLTPGIGRLVTTPEGKIRWVDDATGPIRMYRQPSADKDWGTYFIGADPCYGVAGGDLGAAQVIHRRTGEQVAVWHGRINPIAFADELARLGYFFNEAMISPEVEGPGSATLGRLSAIYPNIWRHTLVDRVPGAQKSHVVLGFSGTWKRKQVAIMRLAEKLERGLMTLHDQRTYKELRNYVYYGPRFGDAFGPSGSQGHDDLVTSLAIAVSCNADEPVPQPYETRPRGMPKLAGGVILGERVDPMDEEWG